MKPIILVPHLNGVEDACDISLRKLELQGLTVRRQRGTSAIDAARCEMISSALHDGYDSMFFIDADIGFNVADVHKLFASPQPVISGMFAKKGIRQFGSVVDPKVGKVTFGEKGGLYPLLYAGTAFIRFKAVVFRDMIDKLKLPLCNTKWGRGMWPFFLPGVVETKNGYHYLSEDWAFSNRLRQIGYTPMVDTTIRLLHWGLYPYTVDDVAEPKKHCKSVHFKLK